MHSVPTLKCVPHHCKWQQQRRPASSPPFSEELTAQRCWEKEKSEQPGCSSDLLGLNLIISQGRLLFDVGLIQKDEINVQCHFLSELFHYLWSLHNMIIITGLDLIFSSWDNRWVLSLPSCTWPSNPLCCSDSWKSCTSSWTPRTWPVLAGIDNDKTFIISFVLKAKVHSGDLM